MKRIYLLLMLYCAGLVASAQELPIRFGTREVYLESNVSRSMRTPIQRTSSLELGVPTGTSVNILLQFSNESNRKALEAKGVKLGDYLGNKAYYAEVPAGSRPSDFVGTGIRIITKIRGEWKLPTNFVQHGEIPDWVKAGDNFKMSLSWFANTPWEFIDKLLKQLNIQYHNPFTTFRTVDIIATREQLEKLSEQECVAYIQWCEPPRKLLNRGAAQLSGGSILRLPVALGGRNLTGKGEKIGVWDSDVDDHIDYGKRVHCLEFEMMQSDYHGMHVTGTIAGAGIIEEQARGIAPESEVYTSNFDIQSNGRITAQEMLDLWIDKKISLTQNSYGAPFNWFCKYQDRISYSFFRNQNFDLVSLYAPTLTNVFALGNEQGKCDVIYGALTNNMKNVITVGAVDVFGNTTNFSSYGPADDGRIFPTLCARGSSVYSTVVNQKYARYDGTSMACPVVTGHLALLTQRYRQLNAGTTPLNYFLKAVVANTARDAGRPGPDYQYGFGILDAEAAALLIENKWYQLGEFQSNNNNQYSITVPSGVKELRVMLVWNDTLVRKEYAHGEKALINDLDLTLEHNGQTVLSWILKKEAPTENATRGRNEVDNIEQVTISNPSAGTVTATISGKLNVGSKQTFALVWYFDYARPELCAPLAGEIYEPRELFYLRAENMKAPLQVELSLDGGKSYQVLGEYAACAGVELPSTIKPTKEAMLRVSDSEGHVVTTQGTFTIAGRVKQLKLEDKPCETNAWKLSWAPVTDAAQYEILRYDSQTESFKSITKLSKDKTEYILPTENIKDERNVYAVRAISENDVVGRRSTGVMAQAPAAGVVITDADLPYFESFIGKPLPHTILSAGRQVAFSMTSAPAGIGLPTRSHICRFSAAKPAPSWDKPFEQMSNKATLGLCELDLTNISPDKKPKLVLYGLLTTDAEKENSSLLRLLIENEEVADVLGRKQIVGDGLEHTYTWDLSKYVGKKIKPVFEAALWDRDNQFYVMYYEITPHIERHEIAVQSIEEIPSKAYMGKEPVTFKIRNNSSLDERTVPVSVLVNGKVAYANTLSFKAFEDKTITCSVDFTYNGTEGKKFKVEVVTDLEGDVDPSNNSASIEVYNKGAILPMPPVRYAFIYNTWLDIPPHDSVRVKGTARFTDMGGALENYKAEENGIYQILPQTPGHVIQVTFHEREFGENDALHIYTHNVPRDLQKIIDDNNVPILPATSKLVGGSKAPQIFISEAHNGGITFVQNSTSEEPGFGWIADIEEIKVPNQWALTSIKDVSGEKEFHRKIEATIKNFRSVAFQNVSIALSIGDRSTQYLIPELAANGETRFIIPEDIDFTEPRADIDICVTLALDGDENDNVQRKIFPSTHFWHDGEIIDASETGIGIEKVHALGQNNISCSPDKHIQYRPDVKIPIYKGMNKINVELDTEDDERLDNAQLCLWINLDKNDKLEDQAPDFMSSPINCKDGTSSYDFNFDLETNEFLNAGGTCWLRLMLAAKEDFAKFKKGEKIPWGHVIDFTAELKPDKNPLQSDLAILDILDLKNSATLTNDTKLKVKVWNDGLIPVIDFLLKCKVNDNTEITTKFTQTIQPDETVVIEWDSHLDLSAIGKYDITVTLDYKDDLIPKNNTLSKTIYHLAPATEQLYSIASNTVGEVKEGIEFAGIDFWSNDITLEGWWKFDKVQMQEIFDGPKLKIAVPHHIQDVEDNSIAIITGDMQLIRTNTSVIQYGKWHHIAITLHKEGFGGMSRTDAQIFVDGIPCDITSDAEGAFDWGTFRLNPAASGEIGMFRIWSKLCEASEIKDKMYNSVRNTSGILAPNCEAEFIFTEGKLPFVVSGDKYLGIIQHEKPDESWIPYERLIKTVKSEKSVSDGIYTSDGKSITILMQPDFNSWSNIKLQFVDVWGKSKIYKAGTTTEVSATTPLDFSANEHSMKFDIKVSILGKELKQELTVVLKNDSSAECDLKKVTVAKTNNASLKEDFVASIPTQDVELALVEESNQHVDVKALKVTFAISDGAKLFIRDEEIPIDGSKPIDLSDPKLLCVKAANGRNAKFYRLHVTRKQPLELKTTQLTLTFGESKKLETVSNPRAQLIYTSTKPSVVTVDPKGNILATGVGAAEIIVYAKATNGYAASESKRIPITVDPFPVTIDVTGTMPQGDTFPDLNFTYHPTLPPFDGIEEQLEWEYLVKANGEFWNSATMPSLSPGEYDLEPKNYSATAYTQGNFKVTRKKGKLTVIAANEAIAVTFEIKDSNGKPLDNVTLHVGKRKYENVNGSITDYYLSGKYSVRATLNNDYTADTQLFVVNESPQTVTLTLKKYAYTVTYKTDGNGVILGKTSQRIPAGDDSERVVATPNNLEWRFKEWKDNHNTSAARIERHVMTNIEDIEATFEPNTFPVTYRVRGKGVVVENNAAEITKNVLYGKDAPAITVKSADANSIFLCWSDGNTSLTRSDKNITEPLELEAIFMEPEPLTWKENFDYGEEIEHWYLDIPPKGLGWTLRPKNMIHKMNTGEGHVLMIDPKTEEVLYTDATVNSPWLELKNIESTSKLTISFLSWYGRSSLAPSSVKARLQFQFEDNTWVDAKTFKPTVKGDENSTVKDNLDGTHEEFSLDYTKLNTHTRIRFRWVFTNNLFRTSWWAIDDIQVALNTSTSLLRTYFASDHGHIRRETETELKKVIRLRDNEVVAVVVVPEEGYEFAKWSDNKGGEKRTDTEALEVTVFFKEKTKEQFRVNYIAQDGGTVNGNKTISLDMAPNAIYKAIAQPNKGYVFLKWKEDNVTESRREDKITSKLLGENKEFTRTALFDKITQTYTLNFDNPKGGKIEIYRKGETKKYTSGTTLTTRWELVISALPDKGATLEKLTVNGAPFTSGDTYIVTGDVHVEAVFSYPNAVQEEVFTTLVVAPNPFSEQLRVNNNELQGQYELLNTSGQQIYKGELQKGETIIHTEELATGVYLLRIRVGNKAKILKVVKIR